MQDAKKFGAVALGLALLFSGAVSVVRAESEGENKSKIEAEKKAKIDIRVPIQVAKDLKELADERPQVHVNAGGKVALHGAKVTAKADTSLTVSVMWGNYASVWTVVPDPKAEVHRRIGGKTTLAEIAVGDIVSVAGAIDPNATTATVTAHTIKDWSLEKRPAPKPVEKLIQGTLKAIDGASFTVSVKDKDYVVKVSATTSVLNTAWAKADLAAVKVGHTIRVYGMMQGDVIEAIVLRDISL